MRAPSAMDDFMFDLQGFLVLPQAAEPALLALLDRSDERYTALGLPLAEHLLDWIARHTEQIHC